MLNLEVLKQCAFSTEKMQKVNLFETSHLFCDIYCLCSGQSQKLHQHEDAEKIYYILEGEVGCKWEMRDRYVQRVKLFWPGWATAWRS